jgi:S1-C subfamily serine protease
MKSRLSTTLVAASLMFVAIAQGGDGGKCSASARDCEKQIRQMMSGRRFLGLTVTEVNPGLIVSGVVKGSPAERSGFRVADKLIYVNGKSLEKARIRDFKQVAAENRQTGRLWIIVLRGGAYRKIEVRLEPYSKQQVDKIIAQHLAQSHTASSAAGSHP